MLYIPIFAEKKDPFPGLREQNSLSGIVLNKT